MFFFLSLRGCPGILSYHISYQAAQKVAAGSMEGLWVQEPQDGGETQEREENEGEKEGEKEGENGDKQTPQVPRCKTMSQLHVYNNVVCQ